MDRIRVATDGFWVMAGGGWGVTEGGWRITDSGCFWALPEGVPSRQNGERCPGHRCFVTRTFFGHSPSSSVPLPSTLALAEELLRSDEDFNMYPHYPSVVPTHAISVRQGN